MKVGEALIQTIWIGALWSVGYLVAPVLFEYLETPAEAGRVAGALFTIVTWLSMICGGLLLLATVRAGRQRGTTLRNYLIIAIMLLLGTSQWVVRPMMEAARLPDGTPAEGFGMLHGISATLYLMASLAGVLLVGLGARRLREPGAG